MPEVPKLKIIIAAGLLLAALIVYAFWIGSYHDRAVMKLGQESVLLPFPSFTDIHVSRQTAPTITHTLQPQVERTLIELRRKLEKQRIEALAKERADKIARVEALFRSYNSNMQGYGHIIVDQAAACGGDYRILIGIAGSESGLGRINYKLYNPYGYLNGVQYSSYTEALTVLSCKVSAQHISRCGQDLYCLAKRYAGPQDDLDHFVSKVRFFMNKV